MKYLLWCLVAVSLTAHGQVVPNHYIVELSSPPTARVASLNRSAHKTRIAGEQREVRRLIERDRAVVLDQFITVHNALVVRMSAAEATRVGRMAGVKRVSAVRVYRKVLDHSLPLQKFPDAWQQVGGSAQAGKGIKIAIIDTGIDTTHPAFSDSGIAAPAGYPLVNNDGDQSFTNGRVIVARAYANPLTGVNSTAQDIDGHGTAVAMIAGGGTVDGPAGPITGAAPGAWLGNYKVFPDDANGSAYDSTIIRAIEDAVNDGMDVLNLSLGGFPATQIANDNLVTAVENAVALGKVVTIAAGNDGPNRNTLDSPGSAPSAITVGNSQNDRIFAASVRIDGHDPYAMLAGDGNSSVLSVTSGMVDVAQLDPTGLACDPLPQNSVAGQIVLILRGVCYFEDKINNVMNGGAVAAVIYTDAARPDPIAPSVGGATLPAGMVSYADGIDLKSRLGQGALSATLDFSASAVPWNSARLDEGSSKGPNADNGIKPDLVAVGSDIYTAAPIAFGGYTVGSGTSYAAPTVAGAAALLLSARPGLTVANYRSLLVNSTGTFSVDGTNPLALQSGGSGILNVAAALAGTITASPVSLSFGSGSGTLDTAKVLTLSNTGTVTDTFSISTLPFGFGPAPAVDPNVIQLDPGQSADVTVTYSVSGLNPGEYQGFLAVQGTQSTVTARVPYWYGVPSQLPDVVQVLQAPATSKRGTTETIFFRYLDAIGLPVYDRVDQSIVSGASVTGFGSDDSDVPGAYWVEVKMPDAAGIVVVHIELLGVATDIQISVQ